MCNDNYPLKPFRIKSHKLLLDIIAKYPLATVISGMDTNLQITLLPLMHQAGEHQPGLLIGHLDRNNPQAEQLVTGAKVAFVFQGPEAYVSPDIYPDRQLPGWLYIMVKGDGVITRRFDNDGIASILTESTSRFGAPDQQFNLQISDDRIAQFSDGIIAFEIIIENITGIAKLAQDKGPKHAKLACEFLSKKTTPSSQELLAKLVEHGLTEEIV